MTHESTRLTSRQRPKRFVSLAIPGKIGDELEDLKDLCQESSIKITERQRIGRNGVLLAAIAHLVELPEKERFEFIMAGVDRLKKLGIEPSQN